MQIVIDKPESAYIFLQMKINCLYENQPAPGIAEYSLGLLQLLSSSNYLAGRTRLRFTPNPQQSQF